MITQIIDINLLEPNTGQIHGLPTNPRFITDSEFEKLVRSIKDYPEMLELRELIVFYYNNRYVVIAGNMRLRALRKLDYKEVKCKVLESDTTIEQLQAYTMKDNISFGSFDFDLLANEWDTDLVTQWGLDLPVDFSPYEEEPPKFVEPKPIKYVITIETEIKSNYEMIKAELDRLNIGYVDCEK